MMNSAAYRIIMPKTIVFGVGALDSLYDETLKIGAKNALIVTDPGVYNSGLVTPVKNQLSKAKLAIDVFNESEPEPTLTGLDAAIKKLHLKRYEQVVGLGGGSSLDTAKALSILMTYGGISRDYVGVNKVQGPGVPLILIPTTAGTGSEVTNIAIFSDSEKQLKLGVVSPYLLATVALVDPTLTYRCPSAVSAASGIDALVHAIESFTSLKANNYTDALSAKAMELINSALRIVVKNGADEDARKRMAEGALLAGIAFGNAGVAAVHALAYPLGARFHVSHGVANGLLLPYVMEYNLTASSHKYAIIARILGERTEGLSPEESAQRSVIAVKALAKDIGIPACLRDINVPYDALEGMAEATMEATRLLTNNPKYLSLQDVRAIWQKAW